MNILLAHGYFLDEDAREKNIMRPYPPLGILYISAFLEQHGFRTDVFDTTFSAKKDLCNHLLKNRPLIIGLYTNLMTKPNILQIIGFIKEHLPESKVILGGPDTRYNAFNYLKYGADFLVLGEGEETMLELVRHLNGEPLTLTEINGIAYIDHGEMRENREREKINNLDLLPVPDRKKIKLQQYLEAWKKAHGQNAISVSTMRGCPYTCKWCSRSVYGLSYRRRSARSVADELEQIGKEYNPDTLWFVDDVFTISHKWLNQFRDELQKRNLRIRYECITRADRMNEEVIMALKETGCFRVWIGAESGSQKVIDLMDRRVKVGQVREVIRMTKAYGIEAGTFIMLGYPGETEEDIEETISHLKESNPDHFTITVAYPIKGTELFQEIESRQTEKLEWTTHTDRQIDFQRTYPRKFYDFAVRRVINEVNFFKQGGNIKNFYAAKLKLKSMTAKSAMQWYKLLGKFAS
jgi:anaerobic magnesium-protoporphyrin IX monomethyl ester cyclase